jgi:hypothetical protein
LLITEKVEALRRRHTLQKHRKLISIALKLYFFYSASHFPALGLGIGETGEARTSRTARGMRLADADARVELRNRQYYDYPLNCFPILMSVLDVLAPFFV